MERIAGIFSAIGLVLSIIVHLISVMNVDIAAYIPGVWLMHVAVILSFSYFIFLIRKEYSSKLSFRDILKIVPLWSVMIILTLNFYAIANVMIYLAHGAGQADIMQGKYVLANHGKILREISEAEYHLYQAQTMRFFSGLWMSFFSVPALYFLTRRRL